MSSTGLRPHRSVGTSGSSLLAPHPLAAHQTSPPLPPVHSRWRAAQWPSQRVEREQGSGSWPTRRRVAGLDSPERCDCWLRAGAYPTTKRPLHHRWGLTAAAGSSPGPRCWWLRSPARTWRRRWPASQLGPGAIVVDLRRLLACSLFGFQAARPGGPRASTGSPGWPAPRGAWVERNTGYAAGQARGQTNSLARPYAHPRAVVRAQARHRPPAAGARGAVGVLVAQLASAATVAQAVFQRARVTARPSTQ